MREASAGAITRAGVRGTPEADAMLRAIASMAAEIGFATGFTLAERRENQRAGLSL